MINVDRIYQRVLTLANKEQRGYITPQEFNILANQAQMDIFEQYFYDLNQFLRTPGNSTVHADTVDILEEKISIFEQTVPANVSVTENTISLDALPGFYRLTSIAFQNVFYVRILIAVVPCGHVGKVFLLLLRLCYLQPVNFGSVP